MIWKATSDLKAYDYSSFAWVQAYLCTELSSNHDTAYFLNLKHSIRLFTSFLANFKNRRRAMQKLLRSIPVGKIAKKAV